MQTGISLYLSDGIDAIERTVELARRAGVKDAFTSLHIPEERGVDYRTDARRMLALCRDAGISLVIDVSPVTLEKLGLTRIEELADLGVGRIRLDFGFDTARTVELSRTFGIVCNASTVSVTDVRAWQAAGADLTQFAACHNFYPKRRTGLALADVRRMNDRLAALGLATMAFVPGDGTLRGPLHEGLPTVEDHRVRRGLVARNMLELRAAGTDIVLVGDPGLSPSGWHELACLTAGYVELPCSLEPEAASLAGTIHHDRVDASPYVFRSVESRAAAGQGCLVEPGRFPGPRGRIPAGAIMVSTTDYGRYAGELEIARTELEEDPRVNIVGHLTERALGLLPLITRGMGVKIVAA